MQQPLPLHQIRDALENYREKSAQIVEYDHSLQGSSFDEEERQEWLSERASLLRKRSEIEHRFGEAGLTLAYDPQTQLVSLSTRRCPHCDQIVAACFQEHHNQEFHQDLAPGQID